MAARRPSAIIAGGGIGGLATAIALAHRGIEVRLYERRAEFPEDGAGIQIGPNGTRILQQLNVAELLEDKVARPTALIVHDGASGRELALLPLGQWIAQRHGAPYWTAHRRDLHVALRMCAEKEQLITLARGTEIVSVANEQDGISAIGANGEVLNGSLLIAADGLWSKLRGEISGNKRPPAPVGKTAFRSIANVRGLPADLDPKAVHIWLAPGAHAVHYPIRGGRDVAIVVIADSSGAREGWDSPAIAETVKNKTKSFAPSLQSLVESVGEWRQWSLYRMPPLPRWTSGHAVLLGDAAHPMLPFLAQGAVMALEDAVTLAAKIASSKEDIERALRDYENSRRRRVARAARAAERNGKIYHISGPAALVRNAAMKIRSPDRVMAAFDWLYGWRSELF